MLHVSPPIARDPQQLCPLAPPPGVPACTEESSSPYLLSSGWLHESHLGSWILRREEGGRGKKLGSFPQCTSADRMKMESRGGGETALQSRGKGWDFRGGQDAKGGPAGRLKQASCISTSLLFGAELWLAGSAIQGCPCSTEPPCLLHSLAPPEPAWVCSDYSEYSHKAGGNILGKIGGGQPDKLGCLCVDKRKKEYGAPPTRIRDF